jgi:3-deoxy-D-manno-octulosonic acid kinase
MQSTHTTTYQNYRIGASRQLDIGQIKRLIQLFEQPTQAAGSVLGGRTSITTDTVDGIGSIAVKSYRRGGLVSYFIKRKYLRLGKTRCQVEFDMLNKAGAIGVDVPQPVAYAYTGSLAYRCWLVMKEIKAHRTLADLSLKDPQSALELVGPIAAQITRLIRHKIRHVDLHPGNVLIDSGGKTYLIDFDRAGTSGLSQNSLRRRYLARWKRAVLKHHLPDALWETLEAQFSTR